MKITHSIDFKISPFCILMHQTLQFSIVGLKWDLRILELLKIFSIYLEKVKLLLLIMIFISASLEKFVSLIPWMKDDLLNCEWKGRLVGNHFENFLKAERGRQLYTAFNIKSIVRWNASFFSTTSKKKFSQNQIGKLRFSPPGLLGSSNWSTKQTR